MGTKVAMGALAALEEELEGKGVGGAKVKVKKGWAVVAVGQVVLEKRAVPVATMAAVDSANGRVE